VERRRVEQADATGDLKMSLHRLSAVELLRRLNSKEISSKEIVEALHGRANEVEPRVHAFAHRFVERSIEEAERADEARTRNEPRGPLHGLPISVKESIATRGTDVTLGILSRRGKKAEEDAVTVKILKKAGAIVLGKTNVSQTLLFHESDNPVFGRTNNPWNAERTPGGSSGGEGAAIASGMSPAGIGTDIGGSLRIPAAFCGISTLKATLDRWSNIGCTTALAGQEMIRSQIGPLARSARDVALLFRAIDSPIHAAFDPAVPPLLTLDPSRTNVSLLRVGYYEDDRFLAPAASVRRGVRKAVEAVKSAGAEVIPFDPVNVVELHYLYFAAFASDGGKTLDKLLDGDAVMPQLKMLKLFAKLPSALRLTLAAFMATQGEQRVERLLKTVHERPVADYWSVAHRRAQLRLEMKSEWDRAGIDAMICPAHATPAMRHGAARDFALGGCYSMLYNMLNFPAGIAPVTRVLADETERKDRVDRLDRAAAKQEEGSAGLPIAVQVVARPYREDVALSVMIAIEDALKKNDDYPTTPVDLPS
jgi:fatty acid amide hydrolase